MEFSVVSDLSKRKKSDVLVIPLFKEKEKLEWPKGIEKPSYDASVQAGDFKAKEGEISLQYALNAPEKRILLLGLGELEEVTVETLRRSFGALVKASFPLHLKSLNIVLPEIASLSSEDIVRGVSEGVLLANYAFKGFKTVKKEEKPVFIEKICFITSFKNALKSAEKAMVICDGVYLARDLVNGNADDVTPSFLAKVALGLSKQHSKIKTTIFDKKTLVKEGFGMILAVGQGSCQDPVLIVSEYKGNPKDKKAIVLIGKGVTYDTGGLNLKPTGSMETMKCDMGGAAAVLATLQVVAELGLKQNITVVIPSVENAIGASSYKPGDVYKSYSGKTVEIGNTDAEGRLILADALAYAAKNLNPKGIIDVATLTGAIEIALGNECAGLFCNDDALADALLRAGRATYERVWRMPLFNEYKEMLKSDFADIRNHGGRSGGSITAALFLQEFIDENIPWAHLDIAATAYFSDKKHYHPKNGTGATVRLLTECLENL